MPPSESSRPLRRLLVAYLQGEPNAAEVLGDYVAERDLDPPTLSEEIGPRVDAALWLLPEPEARTVVVGLTQQTIQATLPYFPNVELKPPPRPITRKLFDLIFRVFHTTAQPLALIQRLPELAVSNNPPADIALASRQMCGYVIWCAAREQQDLEQCQRDLAIGQRDHLVEWLCEGQSDRGSRQP